MTGVDSRRASGGRIDVGVISSAGLRDLNEDDRLLLRALRDNGYAAEPLAWHGDGVDWSSVGLCVVRSTWDYTQHMVRFQQWMEETARVSRMMNAVSTMLWNADKHYLAELSERNVPVVPTVYAHKGSATTLAELMDQAGWQRVVIKPVVGASGRDTYQVDRDAIGELGDTFARLVTERDMMVQPFLEHVVSEGELSLMYFDGVYTHTVIKRAKPGEFRVQDDHGGTVERWHPDPATIDLGRRILAAVGEEAPVYARVDLARDNCGDYCLIELELIEPELFLRFEMESVDRLVAAIGRALGR